MQPNDSKPTLLLLSHCMPAADGDAERARAWQLLRLASRTHRVYLRCLADGPINLEQWRSVLPWTTRASIVTGRRWRHHDTSLLQRFTLRFMQKWIKDRILADGVDQWHQSDRYEHVLCTNSLLLPAAMQVSASHRMCDLLAVGSSPLQQIELAGAADTMFTFNNPADESLLDRASLQHAHVPLAADTTQLFREPCADHASTERLILGMGGNWHDSRQTLGWFQKRVWPLVHRVVPRAMLDVLDLSQRGHVHGVGVHPLKDATYGHWSVLRSLASGQPAVTSTQTAAQLGATADRHLLTADHEEDWANQCIKALRSAQLRVDLAQQARAFVQDHHDLKHTALPLAPAAQMRHTKDASFKHAA